MAHYHVTSFASALLIKESGAIEPRIGPRAAEANEQVPLIYAFNSREDLENGEWIWSQFNDDEKLVILELEESTFKKTDGFECEVTSTEMVPFSSVIRVLDADTELELFI